MKRILLALVFTFVATGAATAKDGYVVGVSGALTGPLAGTYAPVVEGMRVYIDHVNANGGVNGKPVQLVILDNQAQPSKAAADAKQLLTQNKVMLLINSSLSSTYAPMVAESKRTGVPLYYAGSVCPNDVNPPHANPLEFCSTGFGALYDSQMGMEFIKEHSKGARIGFSAMAIPISRGQIDYSEELAKKLGMTPVDKEAIPPPTPDYTPFATKLKDAKPDWVYSWAPWVTQIRTFESLRRLGWDGSYLAYAHIQAEQELGRVKDPKFYVFGTNAFFEDNLPVHAEIRKIAGGAKLNYPVEQLTEGFISGFVLEAALKKTGWPATPKKITAAMSDLKVDTRGLRGGPIEWTKNNHFRTKQYYRVYRWDTGKNAIVREKDWTAVDVK